jgi:hypothetical protein
VGFLKVYRQASTLFCSISVQTVVHFMPGVPEVDNTFWMRYDILDMSQALSLNEKLFV